MIDDITIRKSLDKYITRRIEEVPSEIQQTFLKIKQIWKCENELDFLYGYYVGKIEEGALRYLLKSTRASAGGFIDSFEIRGIIESHRQKLRSVIEETLEKNS